MDVHQRSSLCSPAVFLSAPHFLMSNGQNIVTAWEWKLTGRWKLSVWRALLAGNSSYYSGKPHWDLSSSALLQEWSGIEHVFNLLFFFLTVFAFLKKLFSLKQISGDGLAARHPHGAGKGCSSLRTMMITLV